MPTVFIDGEAGTTGLGIATGWRRWPTSTVRRLPEAHRKDPAARRDAMAQVDLVVLCLPDAAARESVALADGLGNAAPKLLDASTAHRVASRLDLWLRRTDGGPGGDGSPPRARSPIPAATPPARSRCCARWSMPGCSPPDHPVCINAVSGYSGGGKAMIAAHEQDGGPAFELYGLGLEHKHVPETRTLCRPHPAADLRALGRAFPPGDAGLGAAASGRSAGAAGRRRTLQAALAARYRGLRRWCGCCRPIPPASWSPRR